MMHPMAERYVHCGHPRGDHSLEIKGHHLCMWNRHKQKKGLSVGCMCGNFEAPVVGKEG